MALSLLGINSQTHYLLNEEPSVPILSNHNRFILKINEMKEEAIKLDEVFRNAVAELNNRMQVIENRNYRIKKIYNFLFIATLLFFLGVFLTTAGHRILNPYSIKKI
jgi:hypothetical protein